jgi:predicted acylesterase/phospholipase RssA
MTKYNTLVLSGGGISGGSNILGALHYLETHDKLNDITYYAGSSIGGLISLLLIIGYTPLEIITYVCTNGLFKNKIFMDVFNMMNSQGALRYFEFNDKLEKMIIHKIGILPTFGKLKMLFKKDIMVTSYNYTNSQLEYISSETHPDIPCLTAIRMTCNIPLIFEKFVYNGCEYIDGCIGSSFPISYFTTLWPTDNQRINTIIGIVIYTTESEIDKNEGVISYLGNLLSIPIKEAMKYNLELLEQKNTDDLIIKLKKLTSHSSSWNFNIETVKLLNIFSNGYDNVEQLF